jgi:hypothetical protein
LLFQKHSSYIGSTQFGLFHLFFNQITVNPRSDSFIFHDFTRVLRKYQRYAISICNKSFMMRRLARITRDHYRWIFHREGHDAARNAFLLLWHRPRGGDGMRWTVRLRMVLIGTSPAYFLFDVLVVSVINVTIKRTKNEQITPRGQNILT